MASNVGYGCRGRSIFSITAQDEFGSVSPSEKSQRRLFTYMLPIAAKQKKRLVTESK
jgi:hypothetical protein